MEENRTRHSPDYGFLLVVLLLLAIGMVMVYSASVAKASANFGDGFYYLKRQFFWAVLGLCAMAVTSRIDYWHWQRWARPLFIAMVLLLIIVLVPGVGKVVNGARRWIGFGPAQFQPSEFMKTAFVIWLAAYLVTAGEQLRSLWRGLLPALAVLGLVFVLILAEPDLGTALAISGTTFMMLFSAGASLTHLGGLAGMAVPAVLLLIWLEPYRMRRLTSFIDPFRDPQGAGYQIIQSLYALGSGGLFGLGLGRSRQKFWYLPEQHTDFIFAILGEELGFIGGVLVLSLYFLLAWRGLRVALAAPDRFSGLLAVGITGMIVVQALINVGMVTSSMPITGIPLPFLSYGGSSLVPTLAAVGILLNVSKYSRA